MCCVLIIYNLYVFVYIKYFFFLRWIGCNFLMEKSKYDWLHGFTLLSCLCYARQCLWNVKCSLTSLPKNFSRYLSIFSFFFFSSSPLWMIYGLLEFVPPFFFFLSYFLDMILNKYQHLMLHVLLEWNGMECTTTFLWKFTSEDR